ncbi:MAG: metalloregulator ArsR/SmtB family transcription factor [Cohnella sp.]|nr:metalloregulator ArsR/SmtB family transcription factor [Cohnella sp.]
MQLDKIVNYHKALADPTRIRILVLLAGGEMHGQALAEKLGISPPTVTHHAAKLREASLINERRDKNTIYFSLNEYFLRQNAKAATDLIFKESNIVADERYAERNEKLKQTVLNAFYADDGKLRSIPSQYKKKLIVLERLAAKLEKGKKYTEKEINAFIKLYHEDFATIRREFIMQHYMYREKEVYELNPVEMWAKWEEL